MTKRGGYSLFEVLVAFAILSAVLAALTPAQSRLFLRTQHASERILAREYLASHIAKLGVSTPIEVGTIAHHYREWRIEQTAMPSSTNDGSLEYWDIRLELRDGSGSFLTAAETVKPIP